MKPMRHAEIVQLLARHGTLDTDALATTLGVSVETIRRDLSRLQAEGKILRHHGGARLLHPTRGDAGQPFHTRLKSHYADKADIARHALEWITEGMTLALDASSTCFHLARQLPDIPLTVFTNSQPICETLARRPRCTLISAGGYLEHKTRSYRNPALVSLLKTLEPDLFIFSCEGVDAEGVMWDPGEHDAAFKALLLRKASQSLLLIDKRKFNRASEVMIGHLQQVTQMISDVRPSGENKKRG